MPLQSVKETYITILDFAYIRMRLTTKYLQNWH